MKIFQVIEGKHDHVLNEQGHRELPGHTGSVTLLQSEAGKILIDTGSRAAWPSVKKNLANLGVMPEAVNYVLLTHLHLDHSFNVAHFPNARVFAWCHEWSEQATTVLGDDLNQTALTNILPHIKAIRAPGHDECLNSFFVTDAESLTLLNQEVVNLKNKKLCISGDAINEAVIASGGEKLPYTYDSTLYRESAQKILSENPDLIIPGHGPLIVRSASSWPQLV